MPHSDWQHVVTEDGHLRLQLPQNWRVQHGASDTELLSAAPSDDYQPFVTVHRETGGTFATAREYLAANVMYLQSKTAGYEDLGTGVLILDGQETAWHAYRVNGDEISVSLLCFYLMCPNGAYLVTMGVEAADFPRFRPMLEQIGAGIRLS